MTLTSGFSPTRESLHTRYYVAFGERIMRLARGGKLLARRVTPALRKEIIEQLWIVTACVVDGRYFAAGEVTPYAHESDLPEKFERSRCPRR